MKVDWSINICGVNLVDVKNALRRLRWGSIYAQQLREILQISTASATDVMVELERRGWIKLSGTIKGTDTPYELTDEGRSLTEAKKIPRITRMKAQNILDAFLRRVQEVNDDDDFGVLVDEVYVFGSFLDPSQDRLGDVDIAVSLMGRWIVGRKNWEYERSRQEASGAAGWFSSFLEHEVRRYLKAREPYISMTSLLSLKALDTKMLLVYRASDEVRNEHEHRGQPSSR